MKYDCEKELAFPTRLPLVHDMKKTVKYQIIMDEGSRMKYAYLNLKGEQTGILLPFLYKKGVTVPHLIRKM